MAPMPLLWGTTRLRPWGIPERAIFALLCEAPRRVNKWMPCCYQEKPCSNHPYYLRGMTDEHQQDQSDQRQNDPPTGVFRKNHRHSGFRDSPSAL